MLSLRRVKLSGAELRKLEYLTFLCDEANEDDELSVSLSSTNRSIATPQCEMSSQK